MYTLLSEVHVCLKVILIFHESPISSVGRASSYKSQGCGFESHGEQEFFHFVYGHFRRAPGRSACPIQMKSSITFIRRNRCIERMIILKKNAAALVLTIGRL